MVEMVNKLLFAVMLATLILVVNVNAYYCYQEFANATTECGSVSTGFYNSSGDWWNFNYATDGLWSTQAFKLYATDAIGYATYYAPTGASGALWQVKTEAGTYNFTVSSCINATKLEVKWVSSATNNYGYCKNSTGDWVYVGNTVHFNFFEEAMNWDVPSPSLIVGLYNERTGLPINDTWYLEMWGELSATDYTITDTNLSLTNVTTDIYNLKYWLTGYPARNNYYSHINSTITTVKLYEISTNSSQTTLYTLTDVANIPLEGYTLSAKRKMLPSNSWEVVEMSKSDSNGQGTFSLEPYTANYIFVIQDTSGKIVWQSSVPQTIPSTSIYFKININPDLMVPYWIASKVTNTLTYSNATKNFTFTWSDSQQSVSYGSLIVTKQTSFASTIICNSTISGFIGTASCSIAAFENDTSSTFIANGYVNTNTSYVIATMTRTYPNPLTGDWGINGAVLALLLVLTFAMFGLFNPAATVIFACIGVIISSLMGLIPISFMYISGIIALAFIGILKLRT